LILAVMIYIAGNELSMVFIGRFDLSLIIKI